MKDKLFSHKYFRIRRNLFSFEFSVIPDIFRFFELLLGRFPTAPINNLKAFEFTAESISDVSLSPQRPYHVVLST